MTTIILLAVGGTILSVIIGTFWYSESTPMGRLHMQYLGFANLSKEEKQKLMDEAKPTMPKIYAGQMLLSFITSLAVVAIVAMSMQNGVPQGMAIGFVVINWLCFMVPVVGSNILWSNVDWTIAWRKFIYDCLCNLVTVLAIAFVACLFVN